MVLPTLGQVVRGFDDRYKGKKKKKKLSMKNDMDDACKGKKKTKKVKGDESKGY
jgi:hypothetical protein